MDIKALATLLNGLQYEDEIPQSTIKTAKEHGFIIAFGASDDLLELRGAVDEEVGAYEGTERFINLTKMAIMPFPEDEGYCKGCHELAKKLKITAEWSPKKPDCSWLITSDYPYAPFDIMEDGELFCRGAVIDTNKKEIGS